MDWITNGIEYVCKTYKRRSAGSWAECACQDYFAEEFSKWADEVRTEDFALHPNAFIGSITLQAAICICVVILYWAARFLSSQVLSVLCCIAGIFAVLECTFEYLLYRRFIDWMFKKKISKNVIATRKASGKATKRIIFVGHADAAYEMPYILKSKPWFIFLLIAMADIGLIFSMFAGVLQLFIEKTSTLWVAIGIAECVFMPFYVLYLFFIDWRVIVDGANDNLSSCFIGIGILKEMEDQNYRFEHTDVCCLITGGEESGLRGAFDYAKHHRSELNSVDTIVIAADTIHEIEQLQIYTRGINGLQKNSEEVCELLRQAGRNCGIEMPDAKLYPGANDSEAFSRYGIKAGAICGVRHTPMPYYHTHLDSWNNINADCISLTMDICQEAARLFDGGVK